MQIRKPYIALNSETYISLRQQELKSCKRTGYEFYCEELFIVKHKSSYSCESAIYFNLTRPNDKHINCNINNDIPVKIPSHPYVLVNRSVFCNCGIEADNHLKNSCNLWNSTVPEITTVLQDSTNSMRNLHQITTILWNPLLHVIIEIPNLLCTSLLTWLLQIT